VVTVRESLTPEERELVRELIDRRTRELVGVRRDTHREKKHSLAYLAARRDRRTRCIYCGTPTESKTRACKYHRDLPALEGRA
jgi:hypothetical protein